MPDEDALGGEMRRLHGPGPAYPPPLDPDTVDRLLAGAVHPADAPPGYAEVVRVLAATAARPTPAELAGEAEAAEAFRAARRPLDRPRRKPVLGKLVSAKALVVLAAGVVSVGTAAAAATGALPDQAQKAAHRLVAAMPAPAESMRPESAHPASTDLPGAVGLCHAWAAGQGGEHGKKLDATAFQRLATAAGGADKVAGWCAAQSDAAAPLSSARPTAGQASAQSGDKALIGQCRAWLAAQQSGQTHKLGKAVLDRLTTAAGDSTKVATYCATLVASAPAETEQTADHDATVPATPTAHPGNSVAPPTPHS